MSEAVQWWRQPALRGEVDAVLELINAGRAHARIAEEVAARKYCDALNRAWNAGAGPAPQPRQGSDWSRLKKLVSALPTEAAHEFLSSAKLRALAYIEPPILNHHVLLQHGYLGSSSDIPDQVRRSATEAHLKLRRGLERLPASPNIEETRQGLTHTADILYVIRSNLQHGEKFASGDSAQVARDRVVSAKAVEVLDLFFDLHFDRPSCSLVTYGSLAPGGFHHAEVEGLGGRWTSAFVTGQLRVDLFPMLTPSPAAERVPVQLLREAHGLPDAWPRLDALEGASYERMLVGAESRQGELVIANLYAAART